MTSELMDRAAAVGLERAAVAHLLTRYGDEVVGDCIRAVNRGLKPAVVQDLAVAISPAALAFVVALLTERQATSPLGSWSAAVMGGAPDTYGGKQLSRVYAERVFPDLVARYSLEALSAS